MMILLYTMKVSKKKMIKLKCRHKIDWISNSLVVSSLIGQQPLVEALLVTEELGSQRLVIALLVRS